MTLITLGYGVSKFLFQERLEGRNLELAEQASDGIAVAATVVVCWAGAAIHAEVRVPSVAVNARNRRPEVAAAPDKPEITAEAAGGSEVERSRPDSGNITKTIIVCPAVFAPEIGEVSFGLVCVVIVSC
ncbi:hypothetical protein IKG49_03610, partial [Candidatus Saccharibacteria bacterium]|nr:hypothetical protein [Candidatus Saccharibacteria bacterium]